ncbi:MAG: protein kinase domain-containing protein [Shinella sp.]|uniref:protein kinase domain-containing protein n=1 Tax=Shinella sp. TaxID=1870904 RepID=UPI0040364037
MGGLGVPTVGEVLRGNGPALVYRSQIAAGTPVVVKRLTDTAVQDAVALRRFERERRFARLLLHPSLPRLLAEGDDWIAFEALDNGLSEPMVAARHGSAVAVRLLLSRLADALAFVHARGVVHRDVKPAHILFRGDTPVLIDFGIAGTPGDDLQREELSGTPAWMAPEQLLGGPVGPAADMWSLSALGLFLLTGQKPYSGAAEAVLRRRTAGERPAFEISMSLESDDPVLIRCLRTGIGDAALRPAAADVARLLTIS